MSGILYNPEFDLSVFWIPKVACTSIINAFYELNTWTRHSDPETIHFDEAALKIVEFRPGTDVLNPARSYVFVRNPVQRAVSFYYDKIYHRGRYSFPGWRKRILRTAAGADYKEVKARLFGRSDLTLEEHREYLGYVLDGLSQMLPTNKPKLIDKHFDLQSRVIANGEATDFTHLRLDDLARTAFSDPGLSALQQVLKAQPRANETVKPFPYDDLLTDELREKIGDIYQADIALFDRLGG